MNRNRIHELQPRRRPAKRSARPKRRKPPAPKLQRRPHVIVLGKSPASARITRAIREMGIQCRRVGSPKETSALIDELTRAVLVVPPIPTFSVSAFVRKPELSELPMFVVMEGPLPPKTVRGLYRDGVEAVFEWPAEAQALKRTMFRLTSPADRRWGRSKSPSEIALEETARAHLLAEAVPFGSRLDVEAVRRFVVLRGRLDALWKLEVARKMISEIPGVEDVVADGVEIRGEKRSDRQIATAVREVLRHAAAVEKSTLGVAVRAGEVTITGSTRDRHEANRALELIRQVRGVRDIRDFLVVSPTSKQKDAALARAIGRVVETRYPYQAVRVAAFGDIAVLSGRVQTAAMRDELNALVAAQEGVGRVVDKLTVTGRPRR